MARSKFKSREAKSCAGCMQIKKVHKVKVHYLDVYLCDDCLQDMEYASSRMSEGIAHYQSHQFMCPFYVNERNRSIACEGSFQGLTHIMSFELPEDCDLYKKRHCCSYDYTKCRLYQAIEKGCNYGSKD